MCDSAKAWQRRQAGRQRTDGAREGEECLVRVCHEKPSPPSCVAETALGRKWAVQVPNPVAGEAETSILACSPLLIARRSQIRSSHPAASGTAFRRAAQLRDDRNAPQRQVQRRTVPRSQAQRHSRSPQLAICVPCACRAVSFKLNWAMARPVLQGSSGRAPKQTRAG